ncbi:hypothetical protein A4H34_04930 [Peptidiphaga gingivicola]|uniref:Uncharacterized protein n=1 Tax=Peptidiphaga gingivicola TaxID=2741497 RepID=A0A179B467_9ACTO|nr:DUF2142 domain-containing protein [Peptidiphaga gingivicola]OAP86482.1 hypothetical protein A4H34_04930 [Peptidiphaga gingivicola]
MKETVEKAPSALAESSFAAGKGAPAFAEDSSSLGKEPSAAAKVGSALAKALSFFARALFFFAKAAASLLAKSFSKVFAKAASAFERDSVRHFCLVWAALFLMTVAWSFIIPIKGQADEPAHAIQAAAVVRGQFIVEGHPDVHRFGFKYNRHDVEVPREFKNVEENTACFVFFPEAPEKCAKPVPTSDGKTGIASTTAANYPPLYYMAVGWPTLFLEGAPSWYAMRFLSALICTGFTALGIAALARKCGTRYALACTVGLTPTCLAFFAAINPQGPEIAMCFALAGFLIPVAVGHRPSDRSLIGAGVIVALIAMSRPTAALWALGIVGMIGLLIRLEAWRSLMRRRAMWICLGLSAAGCVGALVWNHVARPSDSVFGWAEKDADLFEMIGKLRQRFVQPIWDGAFGYFGWSDNPVPGWLHVTSIVVCIVFVVVTLALARWRERLAVTLGILFVPLSTIALQYAVLRTAGMMWQGRYNLPFVVALVALAVLPIARRWGTPANAIFFAVASVAMFGWAFRVSWRYSLGIKVPWDFSKLSTDHYYALAMMLVGIGILWWLFVTRPFDGELTSIDGGAEGWAGSADGPAGEGSDGAANGEGSDGGDLAGSGDRGSRGGDVSAPAGVGAAPVGGDMSGLISRARGLGGEAGSARQEGPVWRKGSFAAGASLQGPAPSADEQARPRGTSAGSS